MPRAESQACSRSYANATGVRRFFWASSVASISPFRGSLCSRERRRPPPRWPGSSASGPSAKPIWPSSRGASPGSPGSGRSGSIASFPANRARDERRRSGPEAPLTAPPRRECGPAFSAARGGVPGRARPYHRAQTPAADPVGIAPLPDRRGPSLRGSIALSRRHRPAFAALGLPSSRLDGDDHPGGSAAGAVASKVSPPRTIPAN